jgi:hypothetical protein
MQGGSLLLALMGTGGATQSDKFHPSFRRVWSDYDRKYFRRDDKLLVFESEEEKDVFLEVEKKRVPKIIKPKPVVIKLESKKQGITALEYESIIKKYFDQLDENDIEELILL